MLERRRAQLRLADLATNPALLEEWYELIKELDAVLRYGFSSQIDPTPTKGGQRKRVRDCVWMWMWMYGCVSAFV